MTTIAYRDGIMAADSMNSDEGYLGKLDCQKLWIVDKSLIGVSKGSYAGLVFIEWYKGNLPDDCMDCKLTEEDDFEAIVVEPSRKILTYNRYLIPEEHGKKKFFAIGCGSKCAMVAMECGATAQKAVQVTCKYDLYTGGRVHTINMKIK